MKRFVSTLFLSVSFILSSFAQRNYAQELIDLLQQDRCFEARELRLQHADKLPQNDKTFDLVYKSHMALFFNKPDSAVVYLEDLVSNHKLKLGPIVGLYYGKLLQVYDDIQQFDKGVDLCDVIIAYFNKNPFDLEPDLVQNEVHLMERIKFSFKDKNMNEPRIKIKRDRSSENSPIRLNESEYIRFNAKYNGTPIETWFDTGVSCYFLMTKNLADEIGVRIVNKSQDSIKVVNGIPTKAIAGIIDSINVESIKLYNIPVMVHEKYISHLPDSLDDETKKKFETVFSDRQIIMGLPAMKLIGKFVFNWEKRTLSFPENKVKMVSNNSSNIFSINNNLYLKLKINGLGYVGHLDTGNDDFVNVSFPFYEMNKNYIEIDSITQKKPVNHYRATETFFNVPYELVKDPKVYFNGKCIDYNGCRVIISDGTLSHLNTFDGTVGVNFFKQLGSKVIFDFDNMKIEGEDQ